MSDNLPLEIQMEIMKRLPVKPLIQIRTVSKRWKSLIDSSDFIAHYSRYHKQTQHILVSYEEPHFFEPLYYSVADDHTFPEGKVLTIPLLIKMLTNPKIIGSSNGLLCLHGYYRKTRTNIAVLWNLSIGKVIPVVVPNVVNKIYANFLSFGVCRATSDAKIIKFTFTYIKSESDTERLNRILREVEVFTLSTRAWRHPHSDLPRKSVIFSFCKAAVDGFLYWCATDRIKMDGGNSSSYYNLIISFDITSEKFKEVNLPHGLACTDVYNLSMHKLKESLGVVHHRADEAMIDVWMMEDGVRQLFTKLYTINVNTPDASVNTLDKAFVMGFRKSGEPIVEILENDQPRFGLVVYDPYTKDVDYLGINGIACVFYVYPYAETLILLDQPNYAAYNDMETVCLLDDLAS